MPTLQLAALHRDYIHCPISTPIDTDLRGPVNLTDQTGLVVPGQVDVGDGGVGAVLRFVEPALLREEEKTYTIAATESASAPGVELRTSDGRIEVDISGEGFTAYHHDEAKWVRPFLHPLMGPTGPVTRGFPVEPHEGDREDHPHHKGCWVAWGDVNGVDLWGEAGEFGKMTQQQLKLAEGGPAAGAISADINWSDHSGKKLMQEQRTYRFWNTPVTARVFDMTVTLDASEGPVKLGDTKEGGLCSVRVATSMDVPAGQFTNGYHGVNEKEGWGKRAPWCDYTGPVDGETVGVAIFDHPANFQYPTYWHVRNYGLMTANPFGLSYFHGNPGGEPDGSITLEPGKPMTFRYRVLVHLGDTQQANVANRYHHWINPPAITFG